MLSVEFHYRPSLRKNRDEGKVFIRIIYGRRSGSITMPSVVRRLEWEEMSSHLRAGIPYNETERLLLKEKKVLLSIAHELSLQSKISVTDILSVYRFLLHKKGLVALVSDLCKELKALGKERTARAYNTTLKMLLLFTNKNDINMDELTGQLLEGYEYYMRAAHKSLNTISFYMRNLRAIYNKGIHMGYFKGSVLNPFTNVYTKVASTPKRALSKEEMCKLENLLEDPVPVLNDREKKALCLFLFSFFCRGICFVDLFHLRKEDIRKGSIQYYRRKTGQYMEVKITPVMRKYMKRIGTYNHSLFLFGLHEEYSGSLYNQYCSALRRQNFLLNRIGRKIGLTRPLSTHMARHSWATVAKKEQIPVEVISEALGHTRLDTTYRYLGSFGESALDRANRKVSKAIKRAI